MQLIIKKYYLFLLLLLASCSKEAAIDFPDYGSKIVVDGWIEEGGFANVLLTKSASYLGTIDSVNIRELILTRAKVSISNGEDKEILTLHPNYDYFPPFVYSSIRIKGEQGKSYFLKIEYANQVVTAETTIPKSPQVEDFWFEDSNNEQEEGVVWTRLINLLDENNYYRIFTKIKSKDKKYIPVKFPNYSSSDFDSESINIPLYHGTVNTLDTVNVFYTQGDTTLVKISAMDKTAYNYWKSFQQELFNSKNPLATSNKTLKSNLTGNALGVWCGYNSFFHTIINNEE